METETRSAPDLRPLGVAFLWATMKGTSELASDEDTNRRDSNIENRIFVVIGFAIGFRRGGGGGGCAGGGSGCFLVKNVEVDIKTRGARVRIWSNQWHRNGNVSNNGDNNKFPFLFFFCLQIFFFFFVIVHFVLSYLFSDSFSISLQQVSYFTFFFSLL